MVGIPLEHQVEAGTLQGLQGMLQVDPQLEDSPPVGGKPLGGLQQEDSQGHQQEGDNPKNLKMGVHYLEQSPKPLISQ